MLCCQVSHGKNCSCSQRINREMFVGISSVCYYAVVGFTRCSVWIRASRWHFCPSHHLDRNVHVCVVFNCLQNGIFWQCLGKCKVTYITLFFYPYLSINPDLFFRREAFTWVQFFWSIPSASPAATSMIPSSPQPEAGGKQPTEREGQWQSEVLWATSLLLGMMSRFWLCSIHWSCSAFPQSRVLGSPAFPKKYRCYLLKRILSLPHLIIQWWTFELCAGWKITCFSKYKISISAAFASPSPLLSPVAPAAPAIQTFPVIIFWSKKERQEGEKELISSPWDVYCFSCSQPSKVSVILRDIL